MSDFMHHARLSQQDTEMHRQAYNAAFEELGLSWHWDSVTYACLPGAGREGLRAYIEKEQPHLLRAYDADFLVDAIEAAKARCHGVMIRSRTQAPWYPQPQSPALAAQSR
ncbi:MAG: hypothetical protein ABI409_12935 [Ramlibacter sp.]